MEKNKIEFNTLIYTGGSITVKAISFLSIYFLTYLLRPEDFGLVTTFQSLMSICAIIFSMNIGLSIVRKWYEKDQEFYEFYGYALKLFCKFFLFISFVFTFLVSLDFFSIPNWMLYSLIPICLFQSFVGIFKGLQIAKANSLTATSVDLSLKTLLIVFPIIGILSFDNKILGWLIGFVLSYAILGLFSLSKLGISSKKLSKESKAKYFSYIKNFSFPLIFYSLSSVVLDFFDRIMIGEMLGYEEAGLYSFAYNIGFIVLIIRKAILDAQRPYYYNYMNNGNYSLADSLSLEALTRVLAFVALICLFFVEIGSLLAGNDEYFQSLVIIPIISVSYLCHSFYQIVSRQLMFYKKTKWISISVYVAGIINILLNYIFLPIYGYKFGAISTLTSYIVLPIFLVFVTKFIDKSIHIPAFKQNLIDSLLIITIVFSSLFLINFFHLSWQIGLLIKIVLAFFIIYYLKPINLNALLKRKTG